MKNDGYTGRNFNRPGFQAMLAEAEAGKIGTIIVKDMSRFCRNYLEVGFYTEILFPKKQIRFVAINNSVDSDKPQDNDFTPFLNIMKVCYTKGAEWVDELVQYIYENVKYMSKFVKENFPKAKMVEPEGTYLVWVDFSGYGLSNEELEHLMLEEAKLWLDSGIIFGPETAQFERFNVACPRVTLEQALTQLKDALDKHLAAK